MQPPQQPLGPWFQELIQESAQETLGPDAQPEAVRYLSRVLCDFLHTDQIFGLRDPLGRRLSSVTEMVAEGDIRTRAESFDRERQVHKHVGDYILFWSGVYPEFLRRLRWHDGLDLLCNYTEQAKQSYYVVSTFNHPPYDQEAPLFRELSDRFEGYSACLRGVRRALPPIS
ncbi:MAG TPA: hypothetical protein PLO61_09465 [Fimbriimonadaceae bacterium]|nr:hypothetical protein [Fimbriimonadaceae bacterium]HRJ33857.1 hypothetical protein [Fimbriimonadaceae bacterium]